MYGNQYTFHFSKAVRIKCRVVSAGTLGKVLVMRPVSDVGSVGDAPSMDDHTKRVPLSENPDVVNDKVALENSPSLVRKPSG